MEKIPFSTYDFFGYLASGFLTLAAADYALAWGWLTMKEIPIGIGFLFLVTAYILGHLMAHLSSVILETYFLRKVLKSPEIHLFSEPSKSFWRYLFPGNFKPFSVETKERVLSCAEEEGVSDIGRALFFHCHPIVKKEQAVLERLNSFLNLYGFSRNISMSFFIAFVILIAGGIQNVLFSENPDLETRYFLWSGICLIASYGMYIRYLKFFRHYTVEVFISYAEKNN